ncbi:MAG: hypothetical protein EXR45_00060 [Chloroflexi bacterium]|nr:hypothetical protein [Chloroflexota bacterium]
MASDVTTPEPPTATGNQNRARRRRPRWVAVALITTGIAVAISAVVIRNDQPIVVRGTVTRVDARDIGHASVIAVRSAEGNEWQFAVDDAVDMTPGHLREHMMFGEPVTVTARPATAGKELPVAVRITD